MRMLELFLRTTVRSELIAVVPSIKLSIMAEQMRIVSFINSIFFVYTFSALTNLMGLGFPELQAPVMHWRVVHFRVLIY